MSNCQNMGPDTDRENENLHHIFKGSNDSRSSTPTLDEPPCSPVYRDRDANTKVLNPVYQDSGLYGVQNPAAYGVQNSTAYEGQNSTPFGDQQTSPAFGVQQTKLATNHPTYEESPLATNHPTYEESPLATNHPTYEESSSREIKETKAITLSSVCTDSTPQEDIKTVSLSKSDFTTSDDKKYKTKTPSPVYSASPVYEELSSKTRTLSGASVSVKTIVECGLMEDIEDIRAATPVRRSDTPVYRCDTPLKKSDVTIKKTEGVIIKEFDKKEASQYKVGKQIETSLESAIINNQKISMGGLTANNQISKEENKIDFGKAHPVSSLSGIPSTSLKSTHADSSHKSHKDSSSHSKSNDESSHKRKHESSSGEGGVGAVKLSKSHHYRDHGDSSSRRRHGSGHRHHKVRKASIGVQCRRDKTLPKIVTLEPSPVEAVVKQEPEQAEARPPQAASEMCRYRGFSMSNPMNNLAECHGYKWGHLMMEEVYPNGGGKVLHMWQEDLDKLTEDENYALAHEFADEAFREGEDGFAIYCCAIVHNAAKGMPDFLEYLGDEHSSMQVKHSIIGHQRDMETCSMVQYRERVRDHYRDGTFRFGFLDNISLVGAVAEESGGFLPDILDMLEEIPILNLTMPWGERSIIPDNPRNRSNDGPILWIRPGEQSIPTMEMGKSPLKRRRNAAINELHNLKYLPRSTVEREILFEDRTPAHADHVGFGLDRCTTAAVGVLKSVHCGENVEYNRISKDCICFRASDFYHLAEKLLLDLHEPPMSQCPSWLDEGKLNQLYREGVRYAKVNLSDNDIYFLPRNIVHQFRTVTATTSIAWHCRLAQYYTKDSATSSSPATITSAPSTSTVTSAVKQETGSGSEKENENRPSKKRRRIVSSSDEVEDKDPDFSLKKKVCKEKSTKELNRKEKDKKERHLEEKERKEKREKKHKDSTRESKDKDKGKDSRPKEHSKDREKEKSKEKERRHSVDLNKHKKEKKTLLDMSKDNKTLLTFKMSAMETLKTNSVENIGSGIQEKIVTDLSAESIKKMLNGEKNKKSSKPDEKLSKPEDKLEKRPMTSSPTKPKIGAGPKIDERAHMSSLFPRQVKPEESSVKRNLTFPGPGTGFDLLDTIMSGMSTSATKKD